jgi:Family of unknown function (DUF6496)
VDRRHLSETAGLIEQLSTEDAMAKYGTKARKSVKKAMHKRKKGTLKSGSGRKVKSKEQAIAIGLSEARRAGGKVPKKSASKKKARKSTKSKSKKKSTKK